MCNSYIYEYGYLVLCVHANVQIGERDAILNYKMNISSLKNEQDRNRENKLPSDLLLSPNLFPVLATVNIL